MQDLKTHHTTTINSLNSNTSNERNLNTATLNPTVLKTNTYDYNNELNSINISHQKPITQSRSHIGSSMQRSSINSNINSNINSAPISAKYQGSTFLKSDVSSLKKGRAQEKRDLQQLNERFASYIEKVRFLEAQNRELSSEIEFLKRDSNKDVSKLKDIYEVEVSQLRKLQNDSEKEKAPLQVKINSLEANEAELINRIRLLENIVNDHKNVIENQRKELKSLDGELIELRRYRKQNEHDGNLNLDDTKLLKDQIKKLRFDYDQEVLTRITLEHDLQTLKDTLDFERAVHEEQVKELSQEIYKDNTKDNQAYWQNEMKRAMRDIRNEYENKLETMRQDMDTSYGFQIQDIRTNKKREDVQTTYMKEENAKIKNQLMSMKSKISQLESKIAESERFINDLKKEIEENNENFELQRIDLQEKLAESEEELTSTLTELQNILDAKLGMELEICAYRKLLELEETRSEEQNNSVVNQFINLVSSGATENNEQEGGYSFNSSNLAMKGESLTAAQLSGTTQSSMMGSGNDGYSVNNSKHSINSNMQKDMGSNELTLKSGSNVGISLTNTSQVSKSNSRDEATKGESLAAAQLSGSNQSSMMGSGSGGHSVNNSQHLINSNMQKDMGSNELTLKGGSNVGLSLTNTSQVSKSNSRDEGSKKIRFRKTTKGNISFSDCDVNGEFIVLENVGKNREELGGMVIKRVVDNNKSEVMFKIPADVNLRANGKLVIWAKGKSTGSGKELEISYASWGYGENVITNLYDEEGEEKATFHQELAT